MKIVINGVEYEGVEQMPPDVREQYLLTMRALGSADGTGGAGLVEKAGAPKVVLTGSIIYQGKKYNSRDELPPEVREALERLPAPQPGEDKTYYEIKTRVLKPRVSFSVHKAEGEDHQPAEDQSGFPKLVVSALVALVLILLFLWLTGIKPADLWHR